MASYKYMESALIHPVGSTMGGEHGDYDIEGIGNDFIADTMDMRLVDRVIKVTDKEAFENTRILASREGIFAGSSSGATLCGCAQAGRQRRPGNDRYCFPGSGRALFQQRSV